MSLLFQYESYKKRIHLLLILAFGVFYHGFFRKEVTALPLMLMSALLKKMVYQVVLLEIKSIKF